MADAESIALREDLLVKLDLLQQLIEIPELKINEYFNEIRHEVDATSEQLLLDATDEKSAKINEARNEIIKQIETYEQFLTRKIELDRNEPDQVEIIKSSTKRIEQIRLKTEELGVFIQVDQEDQNRGKLGDIEDQYERIFLEILKETYKLEKRLLDGQSIFFVPGVVDLENITLGCLVCFKNDYLNKDDIKCIKTLCQHQVPVPYRIDNLLISINSIIVASINESSKVFIRTPLKITKNVFTVRYMCYYIYKRLKKDSTKYLITLDNDMVPKLSWNTYGLIDSIRHTYVKIERANIEALDGDETLFDHFKTSYQEAFNLSSNGLKHINVKPCPYLDTTTELNISYNMLANFNLDSFLAFKHVSQLCLVDAFLPCVNFNLDFLNFFESLSKLELTLPDNPELDFSVFKNMKHLIKLRLKAVPISSRGGQRIKLNKEISSNFTSTYDCFAFSGFDFDGNEIGIFTDVKTTSSYSKVILGLANNLIFKLADNLFDEFNSWTELKLNNNFIEVFNKNAFQGLKRLNELDLQDNLIEELPLGALEWMPSLDKLFLQKNRLRFIKVGWLNNKNLKHLHLSGNPIETIEDEAFSMLPVLGTLSMNGCKLKSLDNQMFKGIDVVNLDLSNNQIESITVRSENRRPILASIANLDKKDVDFIKQNPVFNTSLCSLNLSHNRLKKLDLNLFQSCKQLSNIDLSFNCINELNRSFHRRTSLTKVLNLQNNQLKSISKQFVTSFPDLKTLNIMGNHLEKFDDHFFQELNELGFINLKKDTLTFDGNETCRESLQVEAAKSVEIQEKAFANFQLSGLFERSSYNNGNFSRANIGQNLLTIKNMNQSKLDKLADDAALLTSFQLDFSSGSIESLERFSYTNKFYNCNRLNLSNNKLSTLKSHWFKQMSNLRMLDLSSNNIEGLNERGLFRSILFIESINLSGNILQNVHEKAFEGLTYLKVLDLSKNKDLTKLADNQFRDLVRLTQVNLSGNNMDHLNLARVFKRCHYLAKLDLSGNKLDDRNFAESSFAELQLKHTLSELNLADNQVESISFVGHLVNLTRLDLSNNRLKSLRDEKGQNCLGKLMSLRHLALSGNQVKSIEAGTLDHLTWTLEHLDVSNNPSLVFEDHISLRANKKLVLLN